MTLNYPFTKVIESIMDGPNGALIGIRVNTTKPGDETTDWLDEIHDIDQGEMDIYGYPTTYPTISMPTLMTYKKTTTKPDTSTTKVRVAKVIYFKIMVASILLFYSSAFNHHQTHF